MLRESRRIVIVGPVPPLRGGIAQHTVQVAAALERAGDSVTVISWKQQYPTRFYPSEQVDPGVPPMPGARFTLRWWAPWSWLTAGWRARRADILLIPWVHPAQAMALRAVEIAAGRRPVVISLIHNVFPHERFRGDVWATKRFVAGLDAAILQNDGLRSTLASLAPNLPVVTVPHPPNLDIQPMPLPPSPPIRLLFLGYVRPYKGIDLLLHAMAMLGEDLAVDLTVAGELWEPSETDLQAEIERLSLDDRVTLRSGYIPDREIPGLIAEHHIVVAPYRTATQSGVIPMAQAAGRPCVATPVGGLPQQVQHGRNGIITDGVDSQSIASAIRAAALQLDALARGAIETAPRWEGFVGAIHDLHSAVTQGRQGRQEGQGSA